MACGLRLILLKLISSHFSPPWEVLLSGNGLLRPPVLFWSVLCAVSICFLGFWQPPPRIVLEIQALRVEKRKRSSAVEPRGSGKDIFDIDINEFLNELACVNLIRLSREKVTVTFAALIVRHVLQEKKENCQLQCWNEETDYQYWISFNVKFMKHQTFRRAGSGWIYIFQGKCANYFDIVTNLHTLRGKPKIEGEMANEVIS